MPSIPDLEANVNIITCSGCHPAETAAAFVQVAERPVGAPCTLSLFMAGEMEVRAGEFEAVLRPSEPRGLERADGDSRAAPAK